MTILDIEMVREWLGILHGRSPGLLTVSAAGPRSGDRFTNAVLENIDDVVRHVEQLDRAGKQGIYLRVTTLRERPPQGGRGGVEVSLALPGLWGDIDIAGPGHKTPGQLPPDEESARKIVTAAGLPEPTRWIHSGGGMYPWWLLDEPHLIGDDLEKVKELSRRWQVALGQGAGRLGFTYGNVGDLARVLRIPGTVNRKAGLARPCVLLPEVGPSYTLAELLDAVQAVAPPPPAAPLSPANAWLMTDHHPSSGGPGPFDALAEYAATAGPGALLEPHGWSYGGPYRGEGGGEIWNRPGGSSGLSAIWGRNGIPSLVVHSTEAGLPPGEGQRLTIGRLFAHLNFAGDMSAAGKALREAAAGDPTADRAAAMLPHHALSHIARRCDITTRTPPAPAPAPPAEQPTPAQTQPHQERSSGLVIRHLSDVATEVDARPPRPWLFEPVWAMGDYGVMSAEDKAGKTFGILDAAVSTAAGLSWLGAFPTRTAGPVLVFLGEGSDAKMLRRIRAIGAHKGLTREQVDALPILLCFRAPRLSRADHLAVIAATLEEHGPVLVIIDPLYLAVGGANSADLNAMGELLQGVQYVVQDHRASLLIAHHWNKTGEGKGHNRSSGVGPGAWGRVLISVAVLNSRTDPTTKESAVRLSWAFKGDEIAEDTHTFVRHVRAEDPDDLNSPLIYSVAEVDTALDSDDQGDPATADLRPSARRVLTVLQAAAAPLTVLQIGDRLAQEPDAPPLKKRTIQDALKTLADRDLADEAEIIMGRPEWIARTPADTPSEGGQSCV